MITFDRHVQVHGFDPKHWRKRWGYEEGGRRDGWEKEAEKMTLLIINSIETHYSSEFVPSH